MLRWGRTKGKNIKCHKILLLISFYLHIFLVSQNHDAGYDTILADDAALDINNKNGTIDRNLNGAQKGIV